MAISMSEVAMGEVTKKEFLDKQQILLCHHCFRRLRIMNRAEKELPERGPLDEMLDQFEVIKLQES